MLRVSSGNCLSDRRKTCRNQRFRRDVCYHLTVVRGLTYRRRVEWNTSDRFNPEYSSELFGFNLRSFRHSDLIEHELGKCIVRTAIPQELDQGFGISQTGKGRLSCDDYFVSNEQYPFRPR